jgi:hypothetical protein
LPPNLITALALLLLQLDGDAADRSILKEKKGV